MKTLFTVGLISVSTLLGGCTIMAMSKELDMMKISATADVSRYAQDVDGMLKNGESSATIFEKTQQVVQSSLKDPSSAQFRNVRLVAWRSWQVVCGEVNAKNSYGGYAGFTKFVGSPSATTIEQTIDPRAPSIALSKNAGIDSACIN